MLFEKRYISLDLARSGAIVMVMVHHQTLVFSLPDDGLAALFFWGWHGVDLFFALSGFLIGGRIIEESTQGTFSFRRFYLKRFLRILPPYYFLLYVAVVAATIMYGWFALYDGEIRKDLLVHVFYLQDYIQPKLHNGVFWSLAVEEQFYLVIPFLLYAIVRFAGRLRLFSLVALALIFVSLRFMLYDAEKDFWTAFLVPLHTRLDSLLMGVIAAYLFILYRGGERLSALWKLSLAIAGSVGLLISFAFGGYGTNYFNVCYQFTLTGAGFSALILAMAASPLDRYIPFKKGFRTIAKHSYTMYLYHMLSLHLLVPYLIRTFAFDRTSHLHFSLVFIIYFSAVFAISAVMYWLVERPCMNLRRRHIESIEERRLVTVEAAEGPV